MVCEWYFDGDSHKCPEFIDNKTNAFDHSLMCLYNVTHSLTHPLAHADQTTKYQ